MTDPIITAINNFRAGIALFNSTPTEVTDPLEEQIIALTYGPPMKVLCDWDQPAESLEGVIEALRLAAEENSDFTGSTIADNMVKAALTYFEAIEPAQKAA